MRACAASFRHTHKICGRVRIHSAAPTKNMRAWRNRQTRAFKGRMIPIVWVQVPSPAPNTKGSTEWRSLLCLPRAWVLEPLPPLISMPVMLHKTAAEKNAELARGKWRRSAAKAFFKRRHGVPKAVQRPARTISCCLNRCRQRNPRSQAASGVFSCDFFEVKIKDAFRIFRGIGN